MSSPKPRRRWYQYRLSTLLLGLTFFSLPLGYVAWEREQCRRGEEAREMIYRHDGPKAFSREDYENMMVQFGEGHKLPFRRPEWLKTILGNDRFRRINSARLSGDSLADAELRHLNSLPNLLELKIYNSNVTKRGVAHLRRMKRLEKFAFVQNERAAAESWEVLSEWRQLSELSFEGSDFRDESVPYFSGLTNLKQLRLNNTKITDAGLEAIPSLPCLEILDLSDTEITDAGLQHLSRLTNLRKLRLENTKVCGSGLRYLAALPHLESLALNGSKVTSDGLASLEGFTELEGLGLSQTGVTDGDLSILAGMRRLKRLGLADTEITDRGLTHLQQLANLETLDLSNTWVSEKGLIHLKGLPNLNKLFLRNTKANTSNRLRVLLPNVQRGRESDPFADRNRRMSVE